MTLLLPFLISFRVLKIVQPGFEKKIIVYGLQRHLLKSLEDKDQIKHYTYYNWY